MDYVTDTHSLVWYFADSPRLGSTASQAFEQSIREGLIIIPSIVLAEISFIAKKGRITLTFAETLERIQDYENYEIAVLDAEILMIMDKIEAELEMHDKLIIATSQFYGAVLITNDREIVESSLVETVW